MHWAEKGDQLFSVNSTNSDFGWRIIWENNVVNIESTWRKISGDYHQVLNADAIKSVCISKQEFMAEWKMLLVQFDAVLQGQKVSFVEIDSQDIALQIKNLLEYINETGLLYPLTTPSNTPQGIKKSKQVFLKRTLIAFTLLILSLVAIYFIADDGDQNAFYWLKKHWFWLLITPIVFFSILLIVPYLLRKK
jgi:hypothetical protein